MTTDETQIRTLIERWAEAVHAGELTDRPGYRLRLTLGLRREQDRWVVAHEHHSFPDVTPPPGPAENWHDQ